MLKLLVRVEHSPIHSRQILGNPVRLLRRFASPSAQDLKSLVKANTAMVSLSSQLSRSGYSSIPCREEPPPYIAAACELMYLPRFGAVCSSHSTGTVGCNYYHQITVGRYQDGVRLRKFWCPWSTSTKSPIHAPSTDRQLPQGTPLLSSICSSHR